MRMHLIAAALFAVGSAASAQAPDQAVPSEAAPSQLVQLPNGTVGVVSADGVYLGQLGSSLDGSNGLTGTARHRSFVIIPVDPSEGQSTTLQQLAAPSSAVTQTHRTTIKTTRIFHGLANGVTMGTNGISP